MTVKGLIPLQEGDRLFLTDDISGGGNAEFFQGFGFRSSVSTAANGDDIWPGTATTLPLPPQPGGQRMDVVSSSANDTLAGTGIQTLEILYLDSNGNTQTETVNMNGVTPVSTVATNIRFVQEIHAETVGTNGAAVGNININATGVAATVYTTIQIGRNRSSNTARMVPAGKALVIRQWHVTGGAAAGGKSADVHLRATSDLGGILPVNLFVTQDHALIFNSSTDRNLEPPLIFPPLTIVKCTSFATAGGADIQASYFGVLVPTPV